ncbi:MAG: TIGR02186 family protein [Hyphomicrobiaceae bacterium]|nr:TIGR02186 family protein [Hyphomicrobiaceae bacterium]
MSRLLAITALFWLLLAGPALPQRIVSALSDQNVSIDSNFTGKTLTLFGNVEPSVGDQTLANRGPFDLVIVIRGPAATHTVREKTPQLGVWLNSGSESFANTPGFFYVLSSKELDKITTPETLAENEISFNSVFGIDANGQATDPEYTSELRRLLAKKGLEGVNEHAVNFLSPTFYSTQLDLPANVPSGLYLVKTFLFSEGELIEDRSVVFTVRTAGIERFLESTSRENPWAYGLASVLLALFTGWLGSVAFKR